MNINQFNDVIEKSKTSLVLMYKRDYWLRPIDQSGCKYDIAVDRILGNFLCEQRLFEFDQFVVSHNSFRIYKQAKNYFDIYSDTCNSFKIICQLLQDKQVKSLTSFINILNENQFHAYDDTYDLPVCYWGGYYQTKTLYIQHKQTNVKNYIDYFQATNFRTKKFKQSYKQYLTLFD